MEYSTSTVDQSDEEMEEDADEDGSESDETWTAPDAVDSTAPVDPRHLMLWNSQHQVPSTFHPIQTSPPPHLHPISSPRPNDPQ